MGCGSSAPSPDQHRQKRATDPDTAAWVTGAMKRVSAPIILANRNKGSPSYGILGKWQAVNDALSTIDMASAEHTRDEEAYQGFLQVEVGRLETLLSKDHVRRIEQLYMSIIINYCYMSSYTHSCTPLACRRTWS